MTQLAVLAVIAVLLMFVAFALVLQSRGRGRGQTLGDQDRELVQTRWQQVQERLDRGGPAHIRQAIIDADTLVDHSLKRLGVEGDTMGDRMRHAQDRFSDYDGLWKAHKVRNQIVHEMDREVLSFEAKKILARFRQALADLGAL